ncbi:alanine:cation symporter family protein [Sphingobacteriaceae bacterium WQ 2009]|uniref:Alanine:cation symporter family protein n=1 Tax=Rhinopithecimicrobium faecis TaxID=2820698 RepID=A0A8T4H9V0_9SPHI|nr:alanine:cation symporter family protein [Sphingobacteriaceae bacterium WQ 2009]
MEKVITYISELIWSDVFIYMCLITGVYFSIRTGFLQLTYLKDMVRLLFGTKASDKGISSFQAFSLAISGRVGTGNIVGVATAIAMGGPGAIFWMWVIAFLGSASAFIEATLGQVYKEEVNGEYRGGPAYYIAKGLGVKWYATLFAIVTILSTGLFLPGVQSNAIASSINHAFDVPVIYTGIAVVVLIALIIFGGVKRLGRVAEYLVPFMAGAYILMAVVIISFHVTEIPAVFKLIISSAFSLDATFGGIIGMAIAWGVKRGIYSNEAGQGTAPHAAAAAEVSHPAEQGLVQAFSVYIDTLFVCTATALMILFTGQYNVSDGSNFLVENVPGIDATGFTQAAVSSHFPSFGSEFVAVALFFFAFTTVMAYYYYAETNISYLFSKGNNKGIIWVLRIAFLGATFYGTIKTADIAWKLGDIGVGLMAYVNIIAILLLSKTGMKVWSDYRRQRKAGVKNPTFNPKALGIKGADFWENRIEEEKK